MSSDVFDGASGLLSFLESRQGSIDCEREGEIRIGVSARYFTDAADVESVIALLRKHNPKGKVEVLPCEGVVVVRLLSEEADE